MTLADKVELEVTISPEGEVTVETRGLLGEACLEETKGLEAALGRVKARKRTAEYWQKAGAASVAARRLPDR